MVLLGTGNGLAILSTMSLAMADAAPQDAGLASGMANTTLQLGGALGVAILASLSTARTQTALSDGRGTEAALISGYHLAFWVAAGTMLAALVIAAVVISGRRAAARLHEPTPAVE
jgi:MFS family permease